MEATSDSYRKSCQELIEQEEAEITEMGPLCLLLSKE